jgi:hypothetical protein
MTGVTLEVNLIDELLAEQQRLTPVERLPKGTSGPTTAQARYYRDLIPLRSLPAASSALRRRSRCMFRLQGLCECLPFAERA